jgi:hypothetical protein
MDERLRFVARLLEGEKMARLCAEFGISRKTGYNVERRNKSSSRAASRALMRVAGAAVWRCIIGVSGQRFGCRRHQPFRALSSVG